MTTNDLHIRTNAYLTGYADGTQEVAEFLREFHETTDGPIDNDTYSTRAQRWKLIKEEFSELGAELLLGENREAILKELADLVYVCHGTAIALGLDLSEALARVHTSNMTKLPYAKDENGKVVKGTHYQRPNLSDLV